MINLSPIKILAVLTFLSRSSAVYNDDNDGDDDNDNDDDNDDDDNDSSDDDRILQKHRLNQSWMTC